MLIVCPSCASQYELDAAKLGPEGRKVRCAGCRTAWHVAPVPEFPDAPSAEETQALLSEEIEQAAIIDAQVTALAAERSATAAAEDDGPETPAMPPRRRRAGRKGTGAPNRTARARFAGLSAPVVLTLSGLALAGLLVWQRELAVRGAPQLAVLFERIGLPVNLRGLSLSAVESGLIDDGQGRFLIVEGDVTNITRGKATVPPIEVSVRDASGMTLYRWTTEPPRPKLEPAELMRFRARLASPPENGQSVLVRFASTEPAALASTR